MSRFSWPLMHNNILKEDRDALIAFLQHDVILTQSTQVEAFENEWSEWLGVRHSVFVNSGASANLLTMQHLAITEGPGEIIVPTITWSSDIASILHAGHKPVFVDVDAFTLGANVKEVARAITDKTRAVFVTHLLGLNALTDELLEILRINEVALIEDCCESHGATFHGKKLGTYGLMSNFSFYYAHHMTTIEGGMISTNDEMTWDTLRILRSHGLLRESKLEVRKKALKDLYPDLRSDFIFLYPGYNVRSTELNAVLGRRQLKRLDANNEKRRRNLILFLGNLNPQKYQTDLNIDGAVNYALILILKKDGAVRADHVETLFQEMNVEYRTGLSGGGNQLRQPFVRHRRLGEYVSSARMATFANTEHLHWNSWYVGNYPELEAEKITELCHALNRL